MRKLATVITLAAYLCGICVRLSPVSASSSRDNASTGGVPFATSFIYPVGAGAIQPTWDPGNGNGYFVTQGFNTSCDPTAGQGFYLYGTYFCGHTGVDLASATASAIVHATAAGIVVEAGYNAGYGVMVRIKHYLPDGSVVYSQYEHMAYGSLAVYAGEIVAQGQELGLVGATGFATGAHLHFEIKTVNEDGWGYTFGNAALIAGYLEPISFVASHKLQPANYITTSGHAVQVFPAESEYLLQHFLHSYKHFVVVSVSDGLHVRSGPGQHSHILGVALRGAKLAYLATKGKWIEVSLPQNVRGWVDRDYVAGYQDWDRLAAARRLAWPPPGPVATVDLNGVGLNVRSGPGQNHSIVSAVYEHDKVVVLFRTTNWARVLTRDGTRGWVLRRYLDEPGQAPVVHITYLVTTTALLHVRSGPGLSFPATGSVYLGTRMQLVRETPDWAAVILPGGTTGWVARPYTVVAPAVTTTRVQGHTNRAAAPLAVRVRFITVNTPYLNVRSGPGQRHMVIAVVRQRTSLQVLDLTANWAHVALPATRIDGWVLRRLTR